MKLCVPEKREKARHRIHLLGCFPASVSRDEIERNLKC